MHLWIIIKMNCRWKFRPSLHAYSVTMSMRFGRSVILENSISPSSWIWFEIYICPGPICLGCYLPNKSKNEQINTSKVCGLHVTSLSQIIMQPIEVATEDMSKKNCQFDEILRPKNNQHDLKMLSMLIQGSIGTTVNQVYPVLCTWWLVEQQFKSRDGDITF